MIAVLDPFGTAAGFAGEWCRVHPDARSGITPEWDKNTLAMHRCVDTKLRAFIGERWDAASPPLFRNLFIETSTGCNATCSFCPNNRLTDPRERVTLDFETQRKLAAELEEIGFAGTLHLFCNNEPTLDRRLPQSVQLFRRACPSAELKIVTNGITISTARALALFEAGLDVLVVNSYSGAGEIPRGPRDLMEHAGQFADYDVRISVRDPDEELTTRAGAAPNKHVAAPGVDGFCALPFTDLVISAFGTARLCCFDAVDGTDVGDARSSTLLEIWRGEAMNRYRDALLRDGRGGLTPCSNCDFDGYRWPLEGTRTRAAFCEDGDHDE